MTIIEQYSTLAVSHHEESFIFLVLELTWSTQYLETAEIQSFSGLSQQFHFIGVYLMLVFPKIQYT